MYDLINPASVSMDAGDGLMDGAEVRRAVAALFDPDGLHEVCGLFRGHHPEQRNWRGHSAFFTGSQTEAIVNHAAGLHRSNNLGVYWTVNTVRPGVKGQTRKGDVLRRRWLFLDFDPKRPKDTNGTEDEHTAAQEAAFACCGHLSELSWPEPVIVDSGNGWYLLYRLDLPATSHAHALIKSVTHHLGGLYSSTAVEVDNAVHNDSRIARLPGTLNRKGPADPGRPRRMCRILSLPDTVEVVPVERLQALAGPERKAKVVTPPPASPPTNDLIAPPAGNLDAYVRKALEEEAARIRGAHEGARNTTLNDAAFRLFTLVGHHGVTADQIEQLVLDAALSAGLPEEESRRTIRSAREAGLASPRPPKPGRPSNNGRHARARAWPEDKPPGSDAAHTPVAQTNDTSPVTIRASSITPRAIEWLWPDRVPLGKLTTFAGHGGLGKTFVLLDMTARVTTGTPWPDGAAGAAPAPVLFISGEDDPSDTLVPRLIELKADLDRVLFLKSKCLEKFTLADLDTLNKALTQNDGVRLAVIDPPTAYLAGTDDHKNAELRQLLTPLQEWAQYWKCSIVFNTHINKGGAGKVEAMARVMGSVAWVNAVRAAHMFAKDPDDETRRFFVPMKNNLGPERKGLAYRLVSDGDRMAHVEWLGEIDTTADQAVSPSRTKRREESAREWLIERFREKREWPSDDLFAAGREANISRNAIFDAKDRLCLPRARRSVGEGGDVTWTWWVPPDWPYLAAAPPTAAEETDTA